MSKKSILIRVLAILASISAIVLILFIVTFAINEEYKKNYKNGQYNLGYLNIMGFVQPYVYPYNIGTSYYQMNMYPEAEEQYREALKQAEAVNLGKTEDCDIRVNLALSIYKPIKNQEGSFQFYSDKERAEAVARLTEAREILCKKGCANMDDENGHDVDAQLLKKEIDTLLWKLDPPSSDVNNNIGQDDGLEFDGTEMIQVQTNPGLGSLYIKDFVGANYFGKANDADGVHWESISESIYDSTKYILEYYNYTPQESIAILYKKLQWDRDYRLSVKIHYTNQAHDSQLMPTYPDTGYVSGDNLVLDSLYAVMDDDKTLYHYDALIPANLSGATNVYKLEECVNNLDPNDYDQSDYLYAEESYRDFVYMYYMDINTDCANDLKTLATYFEQMGNLTPNIPEDSRTAYCYNMAEYIRLYLQNTCTYTLKPGKLPDNTDMVTYFLTESKQGYCSYFASSAVMMLRAAGIPARFVGGYRVDVNGESCDEVVEVINEGTPTDQQVYVEGLEMVNPDAEVVYSVKDEKAHAWVEFYVDGVGWVAYEMTPPPSSEQQEPNSESDNSSSQDESETSDETQSGEETGDESQSGDESRSGEETQTETSSGQQETQTQTQQDTKTSLESMLQSLQDQANQDRYDYNPDNYSGGSYYSGPRY